MGFLSNLFNKEAKGAQAHGKDKWESEPVSRKAKDIDDEDDCYYDTAVVCERIEKIISENWSDCELRKGISASEIGACDIDWKYNYGVYRDGRLIALINILEEPNDYKRKIVLQSKAACQNSNIGYVHFLMHLPNRSSYIEERLQDIIPA